ncbi:hypothetical protein TVAG_316570 [Trichomonas vaginalis G3]|uniref:Uncharacterized protein n=1 Tax=Trichomonas vaginalis (strain ATCC PRA-98 / G3) TaxID=412133 RepID=A2G2E4_TRIV3|nr:hypothetical protein TVAGG3_0340300 [Trichomonas vaginalis G3]EAX88679.1 hypothetical protein TVAG_316570 [Trichomonas vaginalis G3]KAI5530593.1 hypothetical protein TVAGG3_0340300 [Trichomonas vaginalis G3]|eukprot:XP_001301609.1 hypothetical protein [Trichomonas vaginalis G3]
MMSKPFFIKLSLKSAKKFLLNVQITTLNISINKNLCSAMTINDISQLELQNSTHWTNAQDEQCISIRQELRKVQESILEIIGVFTTIFLLLFAFRFINTSFCCSRNSEPRFNDLMMNNLNIHEISNPVDNISPKVSQLVGSSTDKLVITVDDDETFNNNP